MTPEDQPARHGLKIFYWGQGVRESFPRVLRSCMGGRAALDVNSSSYEQGALSNLGLGRSKLGARGSQFGQNPILARDFGQSNGELGQ
jgi:hypothetical protein